MALGIEDIEMLFARYGHVAYSGEPVTQLEHALQSAELAWREGAHDALVTAALLHDLGHLLNPQGDTPTARGVDDQHQYYAIPFLRGSFPPSVIEPIRLHVDAKRALCALEPDYFARLSPDSVRSLALQGGAFPREEAERFAAKPFARDAMRLRRWDDAAKVRGLTTLDLEHFLEIARRARIPMPAGADA
jgi:phosphonate degradation associated HDIG domain protein